MWEAPGRSGDAGFEVVRAQLAAVGRLPGDLEVPQPSPSPAFLRGFGGPIEEGKDEPPEACGRLVGVPEMPDSNFSGRGSPLSADCRWTSKSPSPCPPLPFCADPLDQQRKASTSRRTLAGGSFLHLMSLVRPTPAHVPPQDAGWGMGYNKGMTGNSVKRYLKFT